MRTCLKASFFFSLFILIFYVPVGYTFSPGSGGNFTYSLTDAAQVPAALDSSFYLTQGKSGVVNGSFQYSIPIYLPPTTNNIAPSLSFTYSSANLSDNHFGVGWQLAGIGAITRCPAVFATEGVQAQKSNPRYSRGDRLCFNGQKLILRNGPKDASDSAYWAANAEYKTEIDTFAKIVANGDHSQFTVYLKNGLIQIYGDYLGQNSTFYRPGFRSGEISRWSLSKTEDRYGNSYKVFYDYNFDDFEQVIKKIEIDPNVAVVFDYKQNANPRFGYDKGQKYIKRRIIDKITVKKLNLSSQAHIANVRIYKFGFPAGTVSGETTSTNKFSTITECGFRGDVGQDIEVCGSPITLGWGSTSRVDYTVYLADGGLPHQGGYYKDVDGDGYTDHIKDGGLTIRRPAGNVSYASSAIGGAGSGNHLTSVKFKDGIGIVRAGAGSISLSRKKAAQTKFSVTSLQTGTGDSIPEPLVTDFNNDGLDDLCIWDKCYLQSASTGELDLTNTWDPQWRGSEFVALDVNSDGLMDRVRVNKGISSSSSVMPGTVSSSLGTGSGFDNSIDPNFPHWNVSLVAGRVGVKDLTITSPGSVGVSIGSAKTLADLNGDGLRDLVYMNSAGWLSFRLNTGYGLTAETATPFTIGHGLGMAGDFNGDGLEDFLHTWGDGNAGYMYVYVATIENGRVTLTRMPVRGIPGFDSEGRCEWRYALDRSLCTTLANRVVSDAKFMAIGDPRNNGDQLFVVEKNVYGLSVGSQGRSNVLKTITDGVGNKTEVEYGRLTPSGNGGVYSGLWLYKPLSAEYPYAQLPRSSQVVHFIERRDGIGAYTRDYYLYQGGKVDVRGRGSVGFAEIRQIRYDKDIQNSAGQRVPLLEDRIYTEYHQDYPYAGRIKSISVYGLDGARSAARYSYYKIHPDNPAYPYENRRFEVRFESINDLHPSAPPLIPVGTSEQTFEYDRFGNLKNSHLIRGSTSYHMSALRVDTPVHHTVVNSDYDNNESDYLIGFRTQTRTNTYFHDGRDSRSQCETFEPEPRTLDVKVSFDTCASDPTSETPAFRTTYTRNSKGVVTSVVSEGTNPDRTLSTRTTNFENFENHIYPRRIVDSLRRATIVEYDHRHSQVKRVTDANNFAATTLYDPWGREVESNDLVTGNRKLSGRKVCTAQTCSGHAKYYSSSQTLNNAEQGRVMAPVTTVFYDMLGRQVRQQTHSLGGLVKVDTEYDHRGNISRVSDPYSGSAATNWTTYTYDEQDRVKTETSSRSERGVQYDAPSSLKSIETVTTDGPSGRKSQTKTTFYNPLGQVRRVVDSLSGTVDYTYDSQGNLETTTVNGNSDTRITITHDIGGNKTRIVDPNSGSVSFAYNGFGEQRFQYWQKGTSNEKSMEFVYDGLGRKIQRIDTYSNGTKERFRWDWDVQYKGTLAAAYREQDQTGQFYTYNSKGQVASLGSSQTSGSPKYSYLYDSFGRVSQITYPSGQLSVEKKYHSLGQHVRTVNAQNQQSIWELGNLMDAQGNLTQQRYGNGVITQYTYHATYGSVQNIEAGINGTANVQALSFVYDGLGNLYRREVERIRSGSRIKHSELFEYDGLYRLISDGVRDTASPCGNNYCYDGLGNLTYKTDVGSLSYARTNGAGVHAITSGAGKNYRYDAYGNMTTRGSHTLAYDVFNKPTRIGNTYFSYGADHELLRQNSGETRVETYYLNGLFGEKFETLVQPGGAKKYRHYVDGIMLYETATNVTTTVTSYLHYDHLGSVETITSASGAVKDHLSFNAWGERRGTDWTYGDPTMGLAFSFATQTGFTGHETLDHLGLIHMGGRVYDPLVSRFLSADLYVQSPYNTQSFNRYSYVFNNPLRFYDPTGYQADRYDDVDPCKGDPNCGVTYFIDWQAVFAQAQIDYYIKIAFNTARDYAPQISQAGNYAGNFTEFVVDFSGVPELIGGAMDIYVTIDTGGNITEVTHVFNGMVTKFGTKKVSSAQQALKVIGGLRPTQKAVSGPQVDRLAERMKLNGFDPASPVKVDGNLVVDGHHRVMAAKKAGVDIVTTPGTASNAQRATALDSFDDIKVDLDDWY